MYIFEINNGLHICKRQEHMDTGQTRKFLGGRSFLDLITFYECWHLPTWTVYTRW